MLGTPDVACATVATWFRGMREHRAVRAFFWKNRPHSPHPVRGAAKKSSSVTTWVAASRAGDLHARTLHTLAHEIACSLKAGECPHRYNVPSDSPTTGSRPTESVRDGRSGATVPSLLDFWLKPHSVDEFVGDGLVLSLHCLRALVERPEERSGGPPARRHPLTLTSTHDGRCFGSSPCVRRRCRIV